MLKIACHRLKVDTARMLVIQKNSFFEIRMLYNINFEYIQHFEFGFLNSKNEYSNVFVCIRPSLETCF